ncbi:MAG TPA: 50S ribosomal protein L9 [Gaiellaceae bacterium]
MQVVLRSDVDNLGLRGEVVNVARGYARNFLLPRGLAEPATPGLVRELEKRNAQRARHEAQSSDEARAIATRLEATELRIDVNAGPTGSLFGSVTATNIADKLWEELKIRIDRRKLGVGTIKRIGRYTIPIEVFGDVTADLRLLVVPEGGELPPEEELQAAEAAEAEAATDGHSAEAHESTHEQPSADADIPTAAEPDEDEPAVDRAPADEAEPDEDDAEEPVAEDAAELDEA